MVFSSILFMFIYLPVVLLLYYISPVRWRNPILFVANMIFYGWGEPVYILLMLVSITINYINGILIGKWRHVDDRKAKTVLVVNVVLNLALLGFFKYYNLFADTLNALPFINLPELNVTLPIGISFYTFQTMSYPIDVYRGDADVQKNYISFGTFVALFPQLIAGPIVRYKDVADQLGFRASSVDQFSSGVERFMIGVGKKVLLANTIGKLWDVYAASCGDLTFVGSWLGAMAFSLQIYFDFAGYSDMAIGLGRMIGFEFLENFNYPYISKSITEFWRRWHMSLGTWFRDYLYIPLGGNRCGKARQILNITIVWAATGIWHGANWTFLIWGLYYAFWLLLEKTFLLKYLEKSKVLEPYIHHRHCRAGLAALQARGHHPRRPVHERHARLRRQRLHPQRRHVLPLHLRRYDCHRRPGLHPAGRQAVAQAAEGLCACRGARRHTAGAHTLHRLPRGRDVQPLPVLQLLRRTAHEQKSNVGGSPHIPALYRRLLHRKPRRPRPRMSASRRTESCSSCPGSASSAFSTRPSPRSLRTTPPTSSSARRVDNPQGRQRARARQGGEQRRLLRQGPDAHRGL